MWFLLLLSAHQSIKLLDMQFIALKLLFQMANLFLDNI